jgi:hypothetical protein
MKKKCKYIGCKGLAPELHYQLKYSFPTFRYFYEVICKNLIEAQVAVFSFIYWSNALITRAYNLICSSEARTLSKNNIVTFFFWGYHHYVSNRFFFPNFSISIFSQNTCPCTLPDFSASLLIVFLFSLRQYHQRKS